MSSDNIDKAKTILPDDQSSYWLDSAVELNLPALNQTIECDVVIVGGGIAGLSAAYKLKRAGLTVVVLEKNTIGSGTTGGNTGKVTSQHGLMYAELTEKFGTKLMHQYADRSQQAFADMKSLIESESIDCDWHIEDNYVYTADQDTVPKLQKEADVAAKLGLPATFVSTCDLPFDIKGAVRFAEQAYFNSVKYVRALARLVEGEGSHVFENSEANYMKDGQTCTVKTEQGMVTANHMIIATKVPAGPLIGRLTYAAAEYPVTSYVVAGKYDGNMRGMYISPDKSHYSVIPIDTSDGRLLLIGGESHLPGIKRPMPNHEKLADYAQAQFGINELAFRWKAMDYIGYDSLPLVGKLYPWSKNAYMIGGFKKWGLNLSMVAANLMTEIIVDRNIDSLELFTPHRFSAPASFPRAVVKYFQ